MRFSVLGSGSKGNSVYIESEKTAILIDSGFSGKEIVARLEAIGKTIDDLNAIFLTHEHNDHIIGAGVLSRRGRIPIFANEGTFQGADAKLGRVFKARTFATGDEIEFRDLEIRSFRLSHDTRDPVGYLVGNGEVRLGCCTDTGKATQLMRQRLKDCDGLILEFNHDLKLLAQGPYPLALQQRVRSAHGHLANGDAADLLREVMHDRLQTIVLAHLSEVNNLPALALEAARAALPCNHPGSIVLARQDAPTAIFDL